MTGADKEREIEQWDRYWSYGNIHSFSQVAGGNYQGEIAAFWQRRFQALGKGGRVVDIATGNGAIALLALEVSDRLDLDLDILGVDLADIDPANGVTDSALQSSLRRITFHGRTPAESLPFEDGSVDLACSQFGLEYSDLQKAVPELARILAPGGGLAVIAHHQDSVLLQATRQELAQLDFVLNDVKLYLRARNLLRAMSAPRKHRVAGDRSAGKLQKKRQALQDAMARVQKAAERTGKPAMLLGPARYIQEIFSAADRAPPAELSKWLDEALARVTANQRRLLDMTEAALGEGDLDDLTQALQRSGFIDIDFARFVQADGALLGWRIEARRGS